MSNNYFFYLQRNGKVIKEIDKKLTNFQTEIKNDDELIIIDDLEIKNKLDELIQKNGPTPPQNSPKMKKKLNDDFGHILKTFLKSRIEKSEITIIKDTKKKDILKYIFIGLIILLIVSIIAYIFWPDKDPGEQLVDEDLVIDIKYIPNMIYRYDYKKNLQAKAEGSSVSEENSTQEIKLSSDFFFIVKSAHYENNSENKIKKQWHTGYLAILNLTYINETCVTEMIYDKNLYEILNKRNLGGNQNTNDRKLSSSIGNITFVKINFYGNGDIKGIYYPKDIFSLPNMMYIKEFVNLIIPKISPDLYTSSINDTLNELQKKDEQFDNETEINDTNNFHENDNNLRNLEEKRSNSNENININKKRIYRVLSNDNQIYQIEEYLSPSLSENINYDLREKNNCSKCSNPDLTQFSTGNIQSNEADLENSVFNKTIYTNINKKGILESATEIENLLMITDNNEENDLGDQTLKEKIFNDSNQ